MRHSVIITAFVLAFLGGSAVQAGDVFPDQLDKAKQYYQQGNLSRANISLQQALVTVQDRLGEVLGKAVPPPPAEWDTGDIETEGFNDLGGGMRVGRSYFRKDGATLSAQIYIDSAPVVEAVTLFSDLEVTKGQPGMSVHTINGETALLRWDQAAKSGEIQMVVGNRVLLYLEADQIPSENLLIETMKKFDLALIRKQIET